MIPAVEVQLSAQECRVAYLAEIDLPNGTQSVWTGGYTLTTTDGRIWQPVSSWGRISPLRAATATISESFTLEIMAPFDKSNGNHANFLTMLRQDWRSPIRGRFASIYLQVFNVNTNALIGPPQIVAKGRMSNPEIAMTATEASLSTSVAGLLSDGSSPAHGLITDEDQQARQPGDRFLEFVPLLKSREIRWPRN